MRFSVSFAPSADEDLDFYEVRERRIILDAVEKFLAVDADVYSKRRKLWANPLAPWELRIGDYRVFYEVAAGGAVRVLAVGRKTHESLFIRGKRVEL